MIFLPPTEKPNFPIPESANDDGLLAIGGKLTIDWLIEAYSNGIFPWFNDGDPILWWSPNPRATMSPKDIKVQKSMKSIFNQNKYQLKIDSAFENVIEICSNIPRKKQRGTWITKSMKNAYVEMHKKGYAHSFEAWKNDKLVGGLYGISLGKMFFGESMFSTMANASKFAFISMCKILDKNNFSLIDCQMHTNHLESMGCGSVSRAKFLEMLENNKEFTTICGNWSNKFLIIH